MKIFRKLRLKCALSGLTKSALFLSAAGLMALGSVLWTGFAVRSQEIGIELMVSPMIRVHFADETSGSLSVRSNTDWIALSDASWLVITSEDVGSGDGTIEYTVSEHSGEWPRFATITVSGNGLVREVEIKQRGSNFLELDPPGDRVVFEGGSGTIAVRANVAWEAGPETPWITITSGASGSGDGVISYFVQANPEFEARTGTITVSADGLLVREFEIAQNGLTPHLEVVEEEVILTFPTFEGRTHELQFTDDLWEPWQTLVVVGGDGLSQTVTDPLSETGMRFYVGDRSVGTGRGSRVHVVPLPDRRADRAGCQHSGQTDCVDRD